MKKYFGFLCLPLTLVALGAGEKRPGEAASIQSVVITGDAKAGGEVTARVRITVEKGNILKANSVAGSLLIPTVLKVEAPKGVSVGTIQYPAGKKKKVPGEDKPVSVYEDEFELRVPLRLAGTVSLPVKIPASLRFQACRGVECYPPREIKFDLSIPAQK
jgi:DsbC/DsbD-like thiol-disulfide interchange protein